MYDKAVKIKSIEYYYKQDKQSRRENMQYYTDNGASEHGDETYGTWYTPRCFDAPPISKSIVHGDPVRHDQLDKLSRGIDPEDGAVLYEKSKAVTYVADDIVNSIPKPFSVLNGLARTAFYKGGTSAAYGALVNRIIEAAHLEANNYGIEYLASQGAIQVRTGAGSKIREDAASFSVAQFTHFTSRKGDMQLHTHNVIPNVARRPDGKFGAVDNYRYGLLRGEASALYRAQVTSILKRELGAIGINISISKDGRNISIDGIPEELTSHFSKRRKDILKQLKKWGINSSAENRQAAQRASYKTREDKEKLPPIEDLYSLWEVEAKSMGHSFESLMETIDMTGKKVAKEKAEAWENVRKKAKANDIELPEVAPVYDLEAIKEASVNRVLEFESAFEGRSFKVALLEELQVHVDGDTALQIYEQVKDESELIEIGTIGRSKEAVYTTAPMMQMEFQILHMTKLMQGNRTAVDAGIIARILAEGILKNDGSGERFKLKDEQVRVVIAMLGINQVTATDGLGGHWQDHRNDQGP